MNKEEIRRKIYLIILTLDLVTEVKEDPMKSFVETVEVRTIMEVTLKYRSLVKLSRKSVKKVIELVTLRISV